MMYNYSKNNVDYFHVRGANSFQVLQNLLPTRQLGIILISLILLTNPYSTSSQPQSGTTMGTKPKVIIIGAGISGIGAASKLMRNGIDDITILEAMDRAGGRINYQKIGDFGGVDIGAHWVHGENGNVVYEMVQPLALVNHSGDYRNQLFFRSDGTEIKFGVPFFAMYEMISESIKSVIKQKSTDMSYADLISESEFIVEMFRK